MVVCGLLYRLIEFYVFLKISAFFFKTVIRKYYGLTKIKDKLKILISFVSAEKSTAKLFINIKTYRIQPSSDYLAFSLKLIFSKLETIHLS
jgi:hypothetical protein